MGLQIISVDCKYDFQDRKSISRTIARDKFPKTGEIQEELYTRVSVRENNGQDITFAEDSSRLQKTRNTIII